MGGICNKEEEKENKASDLLVATVTSTATVTAIASASATTAALASTTTAASTAASTAATATTTATVTAVFGSEVGQARGQSYREMVVIVDLVVEVDLVILELHIVRVSIGEHRLEVLGETPLLDEAHDAVALGLEEILDMADRIGHRVGERKLDGGQ